MVIAAAISWTGLSPPLSSRRISRRLASPRASKGSPAAGTRAICSAARLDPQLEPAGESAEGRSQVGPIAQQSPDRLCAGGDHGRRLEYRILLRSRASVTTRLP